MRTTALVGAAVALVAGPAGAQAPVPSLVSSLPCFSPFSGAELTGEGWTPGGAVRLTGTYEDGDSALDFKLTADADGRIRFSSAVPDDHFLTHSIAVTAEDLTRAAAGAPAEQRQASTELRLTWWGPFYRPWNTNGPAVGRPGHVGTLEASGYLNAKGPLTGTLYAHYMRVTAKRWSRTVRVGRLSGECGGLTTRFREFAFRPVPRGTYTVTFDTDPKVTTATEDAPGYWKVKIRKRVG